MVSTRLTKKLATEWIWSIGWPCPTRRSRPLRYASITCSYIDTANSSVTLMLSPSAIICSIAGTPSCVPGILTIRLGRSTARLRHRLLGVEGKQRADLDAYPPVHVVGLVVAWAQDVTGHADVVGREALVDRRRAVAGLGQRPDVIVVVGAAGDGLLEDRRVGRDADDGVVVDQLLQPTGGDQAPADRVEPDTLAVRMQLKERVFRHDSPPRMIANDNLSAYPDGRLARGDQAVVQ